METGNVNFENESVILFKDFDEKYNIYKKEENLVEFVNRNKLGLVMEYNDKTAQKVSIF